MELDEAILDLLDNCVDGVLRLRGYKPDAESPYRGCHAHLKFSAKEFSITDNCGGIPGRNRGHGLSFGTPIRDEGGQDSPDGRGLWIGMK